MASEKQLGKELMLTLMRSKYKFSALPREKVPLEHHIDCVHQVDNACK
jgi:hypothetical protein